MAGLPRERLPRARIAAAAACGIILPIDKEAAVGRGEEGGEACNVAAGVCGYHHVCMLS